MLSPLRKAFSLVLITAFISTSLYVPQVRAGEMIAPILPKPGVMVHLSPTYTPAYLKGIVIHPEDALKFDFLVDKGDGELDLDQKKQEYNKLIKYFLASLTVPDENQWVNLSPYEKNRIIAGDFGLTEMGRDLLGQDYLLKQITSSLMYPESGLGKAFWDRVYERAYKELGTTNIPVNTFNKVWIVPDQALIYESGNTAYVVKSHLKVMLEEDYLSLKKHTAIVNPDMKQSALHTVSSKVIREIILPAIEKEVNEGKNFALLRQVYSGMLLAAWYKRALRESFLGKIYADKDKVQGVNQDPRNNELIYKRYLAAFRKGVYNYIKEDLDKYTNEMIPRKYFAGGTKMDKGIYDRAVIVKRVDESQIDNALISNSSLDAASVSLDSAFMKDDHAQPRVDAAIISRRAFIVSLIASSMASGAMANNLNVDANVKYLEFSDGIKIEIGKTYINNENGFEVKVDGFKQDITAPDLFVINFHYVHVPYKEGKPMFPADAKEYNATPENASITEPSPFSHIGGEVRDEVAEKTIDGKLFIKNEVPPIKVNESNAKVFLILSQEGVGIKVVLRYNRADGQLVQDVREYDLAMTAASHTIFFIDDDQDVLRMNRDYLSMKGYHVLTASAPQEARDVWAANKDKIDLIISDTHLGQGELWIPLVREFKREKNVHVIATSAVSAEEVWGQTASAFMQKHISFPKLLEKIKIILPDPAMAANRDNLGGIDMNAANLDMLIKRDGNGVALPMARQDLAQLSHIRGFVPRILEIKPASSLPFLNEIK